jgi:hypothetical protein
MQRNSVRIKCYLDEILYVTLLSIFLIITWVCVYLSLLNYRMRYNLNT